MKTRQQRGFTLIEVMVALLIVALGLSSVVAMSARTIDNAYTFRERALALYIGMNIVTELRLADGLPDVGDSTDNVEFADREWTYRTIVSETGVEDLRRLEVEVAERATPDVVVRTVTGFVGAAIPGDVANGTWINSGAGGLSGDEGETE